MTLPSLHKLIRAHEQRSVIGGILSCVIGSAVAVLLVPDQIRSAESLRLSTLAMTMGLLAPMILMARRGVRSLLRAEHVLLMAPVFWLLLDPIQGAYDLSGANSADVQTAFVAIGAFGAGVWLAFMQRRIRLPAAVVRAANYDLGSRYLFLICLVAFILGMLKYMVAVDFDLAEMFSRLGRGRWAAPWSRGRLGGWNAFLDHTAYFGYLLPSLTILIGRRSRWLSPRTVASLTMSVVVTLFLADGGSRRIIGVVVGTALVAFVLSADRIRLRSVVATAIGVGGLLWVLSFMLEYRNVGYKTVFGSDSRLPGSTLERDYYHIDDNFLRLVQIIQLFPDRHEYVYFDYVVWVVIRPIPRVLWPGKPVDPGFDLAQLVDARGVSLSSSVVGELYGSGGIVTIFIGGWLLGGLARVGNRVSEGAATASRILLYSIILLALFSGVRSMIELVLMSYPLLAWVILVWLLQLVATRRLARADHEPAQGSDVLRR